MDKGHSLAICWKTIFEILHLITNTKQSLRIRKGFGHGTLAHHAQIGYNPTIGLLIEQNTSNLTANEWLFFHLQLAIAQHISLERLQSFVLIKQLPITKTIIFRYGNLLLFLNNTLAICVNQILACLAVFPQELQRRAPFRYRRETTKNAQNTKHKLDKQKSV